MTAVVVIEHDVSSFETALRDVMQTVGNVDAVGSRHGQLPSVTGLESVGAERGTASTIECWEAAAIFEHRHDGSPMRVRN